MDLVPFPYHHEVIWRSLPRLRPWPVRRIERIKRVIVHRSDIVAASKGRYTGTERGCALYYQKSKGWAGTPYHFSVLEDGSVWQTAALDRLTNGAAPFNTTSVHVRVRGDFRKHFRPTIVQFAATAMLCSDLCLTLGLDAKRCVRHGPGLINPVKQCPGKRFDIAALQRAVDLDLRGEDHDLSVLSTGEAWWDSKEA